jgi:hypothetical protein
MEIDHECSKMFQAKKKKNVWRVECDLSHLLIHLALHLMDLICTRRVGLSSAVMYKIM